MDRAIIKARPKMQDTDASIPWPLWDKAILDRDFGIFPI